MELKMEYILARAEKLRMERDERMKNVNDLHVRIQRGNKKTGVNCYTVSLLPIIDCVNCKRCMYNCYDLRADMIYENVVNDRARNSAIHKADLSRYWKEVDLGIKANYVTQLRINVGGDLRTEDFEYVRKLGVDNPRCHILFFTKNYKGINKFLEHNDFPENIHAILSAWKGTRLENPHNLPVAHVLYKDGTTTAPEYGAYYCNGNCSECYFNEEGCWTLKNGEHVIFKEH